MADPFEQQTFTVAYDIGDGDVVVNNFGITEAIKVRQGMIDQAVRSAAVVELERLGYRVLAPEDYEVEMQWAAAERDNEVGDYALSRSMAEMEVRMNKEARLKSYLAAREVVYGPWREVQP